MVQISAVIITFNEERNIGRCLESLVGLVDEVVVVDSFSNDRTAEICEAYDVYFVQHAFTGHIEQKNFALTQASFDHILSLDADEAVGDVLRRSILQIKDYWTTEAFTMNRLTNYCGKWIYNSGWYPDRKLRLFDRRLAHWGGLNPHDKVELKQRTRVKRLRGNLLHFSYYTVAEHRARAQRYADIAAMALHGQGKKAHWWNLILSPAVKFLRNYIFRFGFLDGQEGWTICRMAALETWWKYRQLKKLNA